MKCGDCRFYDLTKELVDKKAIYIPFCKRYPPVILGNLVNKQTGEVQTRSGFITVKEDWCCGEYKSKQNK